MEECPSCKQMTLVQSAIADVCQNPNCGYHQGYGPYGNVSSDD